MNNLITRQPVAYQVLSNSLRKQELVHAYLFHGPQGLVLRPYAIWLAQSILCEQPIDGLACQVCNNCQRVATNIYADLIWLDGKSKTITKDEVQQVIMQFNLTALEQHGIKVYIIDGVENATPEAMNSLLKFLEEPSNYRTYAILLTNQFQNVMPTIVSRCLNIGFNSLSPSAMQLLMADQINDQLDRYFMANLTQDINYAVAMVQSSNYLKVKQLFRETMSALPVDFHLAVVNFECNATVDKKLDKENIKLFCDLMELLFKDLNRQPSLTDHWYRQLLHQYQPYRHQAVVGVGICLQMRERLQRTPSLLLLVEETFNQLKEIFT
jgi:DNA polymerase III subunit delta'